MAEPSPAGPKVRRILGDISNTTAAHVGGGIGGAQKGAVLEPHTPARRAKGAFTVYEDGVDDGAGMSVFEDSAIGALSEARSVSARGNPTPNAPRGKADSRRTSLPGRSSALLGIDEGPPEIEGFSHACDTEASYWAAMAYDSDGMGPGAFCDRLLHTVEAVERRDAYFRGPGFGLLSPREYGAPVASMLSPFTPGGTEAEREDGGSPWRSPFSLPSVHMEIDNLSNSGEL